MSLEKRGGRGRPRKPHHDEETVIQNNGDPNVHGSFPTGRLVYVWEVPARGQFGQGQGFPALVVKNLPETNQTVVHFIGYGKKKSYIRPNSDVYISLDKLAEERKIKRKYALGSISNVKAAVDKFQKELQKYDGDGKLIEEPVPIKRTDRNGVLLPVKWFCRDESGTAYAHEIYKMPVVKMRTMKRRFGDDDE